MKRVADRAALAIFAVAFGLGAAHSAAAAITVEHGKIYETQSAGAPSEGFFELRNSGDTTDLLISVTCAIADSTDLVGKDGKNLQNVSLPPGKPVEFTPIGPHIQLKSTHFTILQGGAIPCSLSFQNAGLILTYLYPVPGPQ